MKQPDAGGARHNGSPTPPEAEPEALQPDTEAAPTPSRRGRIVQVTLSLLGPAVIIAALIYVLKTHGHDIGHAINRVSVFDLAVITALAFLTLLARSEVALMCMSAMPRKPSRSDVHASSSIAFLLSTVNHYIASIVRAAVLRRLDPENAPTIPQMIVIDGSTYLIEGLMAALLLIISAGALGLAWWLPIVAILGAMAAIAVAVYVRRRFAHLAIFDGLEMLSHSRYRTNVILLTVVIFACQIGRTLIVLDAVGLHANLLQAVATFIAGGVLSNLLAGPGGGTAAAPVLIFHSSVATATAAGLILSGAALLASMVYALFGAAVWIMRMRGPRNRVELTTT